VFARNAEVQELRLDSLVIVSREEHVLGFDVLVHDAACVSRCQGVEQRQYDPDCLEWRERAAERQASLQCFPLQELRHHAGIALDGEAEVEHPTHPGVSELCRQTRFGERALLAMRVELARGRQLDGDVDLERAVTSEPNLAHASFGQWTYELVFA
jgi:hypothetical protein